MKRINNICFGCDHFCINNDDNLLCGCRAFPEGIPDMIGGLHTHDDVFIGNHLWRPQLGNFTYTPAKYKYNKFFQEIIIYQ